MSLFLMVFCFWRNMKQSTWPNWPSKWCRQCSWADPFPCRPEWQVCVDLPSSALNHCSISHLWNVPIPTKFIQYCCGPVNCTHLPSLFELIFLFTTHFNDVIKVALKSRPPCGPLLWCAGWPLLRVGSGNLLDLNSIQWFVVPLLRLSHCHRWRCDLLWLTV